jgi:hypothetical protein
MASPFIFQQCGTFFLFHSQRSTIWKPVNTKVKMNFYENFRMQTRYIKTFPSIDEKSR